MQSLTKTVPVFWTLNLLFFVGCAHLNQETGLVHEGQYYENSFSKPDKNRVSSVAATKPGIDAILRFVATADTGQKRFLRNALIGDSGTLSVGDFYHAASGHLCRYYSWSNSDPASERFTCTPSVACRDFMGDWYAVRRIVNLDWLRKHTPACLQKSRATPLDRQERPQPTSASDTEAFNPVLDTDSQKQNRAATSAAAEVVPVEKE